ncbi:MAG: FAD-dependent oxidoreductase [Pseudomonadota bacterium]|nr:FAD-dependent oxidoreductase [Pseudomonadota bacterium]MEE3098983.1 FAD-dependent oxidoreductase [Pseudomonadota bacterium]
MQADVAIIGAGVIGVSAAFRLAEAGLSVVMIERDGVGRGASFGNAGALAFDDIEPLASPGALRRAPRWLVDPLGPLSLPPAYLPAIAPWLWRFFRAANRATYAKGLATHAGMMRLAAAESASLVEAAGLSHMVSRDGALDLYESPAEFEAARPVWEARRAHGIEHRILDRDAIEALQPGLAPELAQGAFSPGWRAVSDPFDYVRALAAAAMARGVEVRRGAAEAVIPEGETVTVRLRGGADVVAGRALIAAGAWSKPLIEPLGERAPLETERGYNTTLPPGAFDLRRHITFPSHGFVVSRLTSGIRVGGAVELAGLKRAPDFRRSETMLAKAKRFLPGLATEGGTQWMGFRPSMPDSIPAIGAAARAPRVLYAFGHGHLGMTQSSGTARLIADLALGRPPALDPAPFSLARFA